MPQRVHVGFDGPLAVLGCGQGGLSSEAAWAAVHAAPSGRACLGLQMPHRHVSLGLTMLRAG